MPIWKQGHIQSSWIQQQKCPPCFAAKPKLQVATPPKMCYLHCPKCGTSFYNTVSHFTCPRLPVTCVFQDGPYTCRMMDNLTIGYSISRDLTSDPVVLDATFCNESPQLPREYFESMHSPLNVSVCEPPYVVAMFREPTQRLISNYLHKDVRFCKKSPKLCMQYQRGCMGSMLTGKPCGFLRLKKPHVQSHTEHLGPHVQSHTEHQVSVEDAVSKVWQLHFVGLTDFWMESICLFHAMHGTSPGPAEFLNTRNGGHDPWKDSSWQTVSISPRGPHNASLLGGLQDPVDTAVFKAAVARFQRDMSRHTTCSTAIE